MRNTNIQLEIRIVFSKVKILFWSTEGMRGVSSFHLSFCSFFILIRLLIVVPVCFGFHLFIDVFYVVILSLENYLTLFLLIFGLM